MFPRIVSEKEDGVLRDIADRSPQIPQRNAVHFDPPRKIVPWEVPRSVTGGYTESSSRPGPSYKNESLAFINREVDFFQYRDAPIS